MLPRVNYENGTFEGPVVNLTPAFGRLYESLTGSNWADVMATLSHWWDVYSIIAIIISLLFFVGFVYAKIRYGELSDIEQAELREAERRWAEQHGLSETKNSRWTEIQQHIIENSPQAWKIAIIEADILLEETLTNAGYVGVTIGEKLKSANTTSFTTLQDAWEAHKVRNQIAHQGGDFILTKKIAQETLTRFERVFREFGVI